MITNYETYRSEIETFDIVLFKGTGIVSNVICKITNSDFSHVGLAVRLDAFNQVLVFESTTLSNVKDVKTGTFIKGVQLVPLSGRVGTYDGEIWVQEIVGPRTNWMERKLAELIREYHGVPYEESKFELLAAAVDRYPMFLNEPDCSSLFCSEIGAMVLQGVEMIEKGTSPNEYTPDDFDGKLALTPNYSFGQKVQIR